MSFATHSSFLEGAAPQAGAGIQDDSENEMEWEAVEGDATPKTVDSLFSDHTSQTARTTPDPVEESASRLNDRSLRNELHRIHTLALMCAVRHRNALINDPLLHARLLSMVPLSVQDTFLMPPKIAAQARVDTLDRALRELLSWWKDNFEIDQDLTDMKHQTFESWHQTLATRDTFEHDELFQQLCTEGLVSQTAEGSKAIAQGSKKGLGKASAHHEVIRDSKSLMKRALSLCGSAEMSVLLFVALCRALRLQTRIVASLQPVSLASVKSTAKASDIEVATKGTKRKAAEAAKVGRRKSQKVTPIRSIGGTRHHTSFPRSGTSEAPIELDDTFVAGRAEESKPLYVRTCTKRPKEEPPTFWAEVYSRDLGRWISIDVLRGRLHCERIMAPSIGNEENHLVYVMACERDGHVRDVTIRYADEWYLRGWRERPVEARSNEGWWQEAIDHFARRYQVKRDILENEDLRICIDQQLNIFPSVMGEFKDHPRYILERFLKRDQACYPRAPVGLLWNNSEHVFLRSSIVHLRVPLAWRRLGRSIKLSQISLPVKTAVARAGGRPDEGLYAESQTELMFNAPVVADSPISCASDGYIHIFQPHMLPEGGAHLTFKGAAEAASEHGYHYAEAVTDLVVRKGKTVPVVNGIVLFVEHAVILQQLHDEASTSNDVKQQKKVAAQRWALLLRKVAIKERLLAQSAGAAASKADAIDEFEL